MPGRITCRDFREYFNPEFQPVKLPRSQEVTRGVTGRDNYQYSATVTGKATGEA